MDKWVDIIIPMHNCEETIADLLDSILLQEMDKDEYQVICANDNCTDKTIEVVEQYKDKMNIKETTTADFGFTVHCPGNTRYAGLAAASGPWITFIDHDDTFLPGAFNTIKQIIADENPQYYIATYFDMYENRTDNVLRHYDNPGLAQSWLHGKWYNKPNLIDKYNIQFKKDLSSQEDIYFNAKISCALAANELAESTHYTYHEVVTYHWNNNPNSEGHRQIATAGETTYNFIEYYFEDFLVSTVDTWLEELPNCKGKGAGLIINQVCWNMLMSYLYFENMRYRLLGKSRPENYGLLLKYFNRLFSIISKDDFMKIVYSNPIDYYKNKEKVAMAFGNFIEVDSLRDVVNMIN